MDQWDYSTTKHSQNVHPARVHDELTKGQSHGGFALVVVVMIVAMGAIWLWKRLNRP